VSTDGVGDDAPTSSGSRRLRHLTRLLSGIAAFCLFAMMALTFADVLGRYVFNSPINGAFEIVEFLLALVIFSGLPLVALDDAHITVSIFDKLFKPHALRVKKLVLSLGSAAAVAFIADRMWHQASDMVVSQTISGVLEVSLAPVVFAMAALAAVTCVVEIVLAIEHWRAGDPQPAGGSAGHPTIPHR
jgi:TRAP-type transport system small permease protein